MKHSLLVFIFMICISLDLASKYYFENYFVRDYCIVEESKNYTESTSFGWLSPELFCSSEYQGWTILDSYKDEANVSLIWDFLTLHISYNRWVAFSLPVQGFFLQSITVILIFWIIFYFIKVEYPKNIQLLNIGYTLILAGAISHGYERIWNWYVVDFISVKYFAILNFADIFITIGACFIFFVYYVRKQ